MSSYKQEAIKQIAEAFKHRDKTTFDPFRFKAHDLLKVHVEYATDEAYEEAAATLMEREIIDLAKERCLQKLKERQPS